jgi:hypothetical protein
MTFQRKNKIDLSKKICNVILYKVCNLAHEMVVLGYKQGLNWKNTLPLKKGSGQNN